MKNASNSIRNRFRDFRACSAVLRPTAPLRTAGRGLHTVHKRLMRTQMSHGTVVGQGLSVILLVS